jgi:hypothetical protein
MKHAATAMMLLCLLATAGCAISQRAVSSAGADVESVSDATIDLAERATAKCQEFSCEP